MSDYGEVKALKEGLYNVKQEVSGIRADIKDLTKAFRELVRIDGNNQTIREAQARMGVELDDHEHRLRAVEQFRQVHGATDRVRWGIAQWAVTFLLGGGMSIVTGAIVWMLR